MLQYHAGRCRRSVAARRANRPRSGGPVACTLRFLDTPPRGGPPDAQPAGRATAPNSGPVATTSPTKTYRPHKACVLLGLQQGRQRTAHGGALLLELPAPAHNHVASGNTHNASAGGCRGNRHRQRRPPPPTHRQRPHPRRVRFTTTKQDSKTSGHHTQAQKQQKRDSTQHARAKECKRGARAASPPRPTPPGGATYRRYTLKLPTRYNPPPMTSAPASISSDARGPTLLGTFRATPMEAYPPGGAMSCTPTRGGGRGGTPPLT